MEVKSHVQFWTARGRDIQNSERQHKELVHFKVSYEWLLAKKVCFPLFLSYNFWWYIKLTSGFG